MPEKYIRKIFQRQRQSAGFTLIELLVSVAIGWIVISGLLYFIVQMLQTDRKEFALSQTQAEMDEAVEYIKTELEEAVYIYEGECLTKRDDNGTTKEIDEFCPGIVNSIKFPANVTPVLAFWKLDDISKSNGTLPGNCSSSADPARCNTLKLIRNTYTLVVYSLKQDTTSPWQGPAQLTRYELREFAPAPASLNNLTQTVNWSDPVAVNFSKWPCDSLGKNCAAQQAYSEGGDTTNAAILVDLVDYSASDLSWESCPDALNYSRTPPDSLNPKGNSSFYACVRRPEGSLQDAIVYLRGNALQRAGIFGRNTTYLPKMQARVQMRSMRERKPNDIP